MTSIHRLDGVRALLKSHPEITKSKIRDAEYAERYVARHDNPIVIEPRGEKHTNIWVRADSVDHSKLGDLGHQKYENASEGKKRPNHDLYTDPRMCRVDLIRYKVKSMWEAVRVFREVAGSGAGN